MFKFSSLFNKRVHKETAENEARKSIMNLKELDHNTTIYLPKFFKLSLHELTTREKNNNYIAYYKDGFLYNVYPRNQKVSLDEDRQIAYEARFMVLDGKKYDLCNPKDIVNIEFPNYTLNDGAFGYVTLNLAYIMNMRAKNVWTLDIAVPFIFMTVNLMIKSNIQWSKKDYIRHIVQLEGLGGYEYAQYLQNELNTNVPYMTDDDYFSKLALKSQIELAKMLNTDLLEMTYLATTCSECAKYQGRVYSISGKDVRFPKLPDFVYSYGGIHKKCHHNFFAFNYTEGATIEKYDENKGWVYLDAIKNSNRPFVDDRTQEEKERYEKSLNKPMPQYDEREHLIKYIRRRIEYEWVLDNLPDVAPKSMGGYTKMKHMKSKNFIKIKNMAAEQGKILDENL